MFTRKLVPIDQIISDVIDMTDEEVLRIRPTMHKWAMFADKKIKSYYQFKRKVSTEIVSNCTIPIPCDAVYLFYLMLGNHSCDCTTLWDKLDNSNGINESIYHKRLHHGDESIDKLFYYFEDGHHEPIHFNWTQQGDCIVIEDAHLNGQKMTLLYYGYQEDKDGRLLVWDTHTDAIENFLKCFIADKLQFKNFQTMKFNKWEMMYIQRLDEKYHRSVREARAMDAEMSPSEQDYVFSFINNPVSGKGNLWLR